MTREEALNQALKTYGEDVARAGLVYRGRMAQARRHLQEELHRAEGDLTLALDQAREALLAAAGLAGAVFIQELEQGKGGVK